MKIVDLHMHTTASDGSYAPGEVVQLAYEKGLAAMAVTDHDTTVGIAEAVRAGQALGIEVVPGVEISTSNAGDDVHVLGYWPNQPDLDLQDALVSLQNTRQKRNARIVAKLNELGIKISVDEIQLKQTQRGGNIGRPHIAQVLVDKGVVDSMQEAFDRFLANDAPAYVQVERISPHEAVRMITRHGGLPVLAHPALYRDTHLASDLVGDGLVGIEVWHPEHDTEEVHFFHQEAVKLGLIPTGGSDFHGYRSEGAYHADIGSQHVTYEVYTALVGHHN